MADIVACLLAGIVASIVAGILEGIMVYILRRYCAGFVGGIVADRPHSCFGSRFTQLGPF